jgi:uncharacterized membrane protein/predicted DsbA family dithiol-disulfide isomerase
MRSIKGLEFALFAASLGPALAGVTASAMLAVDYLRPAPVFCAEASGCEAVRHTLFAAPLGIPMPVVGLIGFVAIGATGLVAGRKARLLELALSGGAALVGLLLLFVQVGLHRFCPYCCVADASGIASLGAAVWRLLRVEPVAFGRVSVYSGALSLTAAALIPMALGWHMRPRPPALIRAQIAETPKGKVTVIDCIDFECPFCRMMHEELAPLLAAYKGRVRLVRRQVPLRIHPHALDAARAACCAEKLGEGDAMAEALFGAPVEELTPEGCEKLAERVGLALAPYRACIADPGTDQRIEADRSEFKATGGYALPTVWIGDRELVGAQPAGVLASALEGAVARAAQ